MYITSGFIPLLILLARRRDHRGEVYRQWGWIGPTRLSRRAQQLERTEGE